MSDSLRGGVHCIMSMIVIIIITIIIIMSMIGACYEYEI